MRKAYNTITTAQELINALTKVGRTYNRQYPSEGRYGFLLLFRHDHQRHAHTLETLKGTTVEHILNGLNTSFFQDKSLSRGELLDAVMSVLNRTEIESLVVRGFGCVDETMKTDERPRNLVGDAISRQLSGRVSGQSPQAIGEALTKVLSESPLSRNSFSSCRR